MKKFLTQKQVNKLKDGDKVWVIWSGGNGPHLYTVENKNGVVWARECDSVIDFVGEAPLTQVWKQEKRKRRKGAGR